MAYNLHKDKKAYFKVQSETTAEYIIPFIAGEHHDWSKEYVMEVGCAEGAVLSTFLRYGAKGVGVELNENRANMARDFLRDFIDNGQAEVFSKNIYDFDQSKRQKPSLIVLKDVVEHIPDQEKLIPKLGEMLAPGGRVFFAFPPWQMPFGGHQQICESEILSITPFFHLLPKKLYQGILKMAGESPACIKELSEIKDTGISIERFERIVKQNKMPILKKKAFLFNPVYEKKFGIPPREQSPFISKLPVIRNYLTTGMYYLIGKQGSSTGDTLSASRHQH